MIIRDVLSVEILISTTGIVTVSNYANLQIELFSNSGSAWIRKPSYRVGFAKTSSQMREKSNKTRITHNIYTANCTTKQFNASHIYTVIASLPLTPVWSFTSYMYGLRLRWRRFPVCHLRRWLPRRIVGVHADQSGPLHGASVRSRYVVSSSGMPGAHCRTMDSRVWKSSDVRPNERAAV